ncbi:YiiX/YebB-like N1pC/P60 family cysteine hydrolase [Flavobacteriales bacterium]|nr:YiiX/YebB-like N1pC/P60 family cysteine hydrolase [Flavobacteriales bacterium]
MKKYFYLFFISILSCNTNFQLKEGDLLFQDLDSSPLCDAIELVTTGYKGANLSHIGLIVADHNKLKVLEAISPKITLTEIDDFLNRSFDKDGNPKVIVGRLKYEFRNAIPSAINFTKEQLGIRYDNVFLMNNNSYYCSELIYEAFKKDSIFNLQPMNFIDPNTKDLLATWKKYYEKLKVDIPQNELGINPGIISVSNKIKIVHFYGTPDGINN